MSAYLNTRVSLYAGRLWPVEYFDVLLRTPDAEMGDMLAERGLPLLAAGFTEHDRPATSTDVLSLEQRIIAQTLEETRVLIRPLNGDARNLLIYWTARFEVSNVKTLLRGKMTGERPAVLLARLTPMGAFGRLDNHALAHTEDVTELLRKLEAGPFASIVSQAKRAFEQSQDPFNLDAALDRAYYEGLARRAQPLERVDGAGLRTLMADLIDRINLTWLLRYRFNYNLPPAQVYFLLVGAHYTLSAAYLRELAALGSLEAVLDKLPPGLRTKLASVTDIPGVFAAMELAAAENALKVLRSNAPAISRAFAYLLLRERDLRAVRAVLRGRHLGLPEIDIRFALQQGQHQAALGGI
jgi:V/A-type H+-transporting ATPase subunit C